jgi:hypothetical protein
MNKIFLSVVLCCVPIGVIAGCGGGGGGNGGGPNLPTATPINQNTVIVRLRDDQNGIVDGIVTLPGKSPQATISGETTFVGVTVGNQTLTAEVNGIPTPQNITVNEGETIVTVVINANVTPTATSTVPPPPTPIPTPI